MLENLKLRRSGNSMIGNCPCCGYKNALSVTEKNGRKLYHCHVGCSQPDLWKAICGDNWDTRKTYIEPKPVSQNLQDYIRRLWQSSLPAKGSTVEIYLQSRGITSNIPASLRFLPHHHHKPTETFWPVMLAAVTNYQGKLQAIHRTYLLPGGKGKAAIAPDKMTLAPVGGYATHLAKAGEKLAITEGIETGLSVQQALQIPVWAALSAGGIEKLILPPLPLASDIIIATDNDTNKRGQGASEIAATSWIAEGRRVQITMPPVPGIDFNDLLREVA